MLIKHERRWTILFVGAGLIILAAFGGISYYALSQIYVSVNDINTWREQYNALGDIGETVITQQGAEAVAAVNALPGLRLPADARDVYFAREGTTIPFYWLRFEVPPAALGDFLSVTCFADTPLTPGYTPQFAYDNHPDVRLLLDWWQPDAPADQRSGGLCNPERDVSFELFVDQRLDTAWFIYLEIVVS
jgi:hypothetical protein